MRAVRGDPLVTQVTRTRSAPLGWVALGSACWFRFSGGGEGWWWCCAGISCQGYEDARLSRSVLAVCPPQTAAMPH